MSEETKTQSSFYLPMKLLKGERQKAMLALYDVCRALDDVTDDIKDVKKAKAELSKWKKDIAKAYQGDAEKCQFKEIKALVPYITQFELPQEYFDTMIEGFMFDIEGHAYKPSLEELEHYAYAVASCVGLLSIRIFGYHGNTTPQFAEHLGKGLQYINIIRDVAEDAAKNRIYLPKEILLQAGIEDVQTKALTSEDPSLMQCLGRAKRSLATLAVKHMQEAEQCLDHDDRSSMRPALLMQAVYMLYLTKMQEQGFERSEYQLSLDFWDKLKLWKAAMGISRPELVAS